MFKNYCGSFDKNIDENITKARKKQECYSLLSLTGEEWILWYILRFGDRTVTKSGLEKLERCQRWFLKKLFHLPHFVDILTLPKIPKVVLDILKLRLNMLKVDSDSKSTGFLGEILHSLETYNLMPYLLLWQRV